MSQTLKSYEIRYILQAAIDGATGDTVTLERAVALKIRDYIRANQSPMDQLRRCEEQMMGYLQRDIDFARKSGRLHPEALAWLQETEHLVAPRKTRKRGKGFGP